MTKKCYETHISKCLETLQMVPNYEDIGPVIEKICSSKRVIFCTMGKSAFACRKIVYTARSFGLDWHDLDVCHAFHGDAGIVKDGDLLIFVSKSGETKETIDVAKYFSDWDTVGVSSVVDSTLNKECKDNIIIPVPEEASPFGYAPMISTSMYMIVLHAILCETVEKRGIELSQYARNHPAGKIGENIKNAKV